MSFDINGSGPLPAPTLSPRERLSKLFGMHRYVRVTWLHGGFIDTPEIAAAYVAEQSPEDRIKLHVQDVYLTPDAFEAIEILRLAPTAR